MRVSGSDSYALLFLFQPLEAGSATSICARFSISCPAAKAFAWRHKHDVRYASAGTGPLT